MSGQLYSLFSVTGLELEYPIVGRDLRVAPLVEPLFRAIAGHPASEARHGNAEYSNEFCTHVFELKTAGPERSLVDAERYLMEGVRHVSEILREQFDARLLPTGMHPTFRPRSGKIWTRSRRTIFEAYQRLFPVHSHGFMNVHSCHINLPFGSENETVLLHNAICCLLPYLTALSASSPVYDGKPGPAIDNRLAFYTTNQKRIPVITGSVVPEYMTAYRQYRSQVLRPIYRELAKIPGTEPLRHEWMNSRGAILRFNRSAIEIRTLDSQECVKMDVAIAVFVRGALRWLVGELAEGRIELPEHAMLVDDFERVVSRGSKAKVRAAHLQRDGRRVLPVAVLGSLLERAEALTPDPERGYLRLVEHRLREGNLSERILAKLGRRRSADAIMGIYTELADCLENNEVWVGQTSGLPSTTSAP